MRWKNETGLPSGAKVCARQPPQCEMMVVVRGKWRLRPGEPLQLMRSDVITEAQIATATELDERGGASLEHAAVVLGQGPLRGETFREDDVGQKGEALYPGDFADSKLQAEVMVRGTCHAPSSATQCEVGFGVGDFEKTLRVVGPRVRTDEIAGGAATAPKPIERMAVDYAHAYGGPGFPANPVGKGHVRDVTEEEEKEDLYQPPRSTRSQVMPAAQLPNVLYEDGAEHRGGVPAGLGPISSRWPLRAARVGTKYDDEWRATRAPFQSSDFDWRFFHAAPPDQQLKGYLRGDEALWFRHLHAERVKVTAQLPGVTPRVLVLDEEDRVREVAMRLDTLFADLDEGAIYLTWRGHTPARNYEMEDLRFGLVHLERLGQERPREDLEAELRAFAKDPVGLDAALPEGFEELSAGSALVDQGSDEELEAAVDAAMASEEPGGPIGALLGAMMGKPGRDAVARDPAGLERAAATLPPEELRTRLLGALRGTGGGPSPTLRLKPGEPPRVSVASVARQADQQLAAVEAKDEAARAKMEEARARMRAAVTAVEPDADLDRPLDEPGPGAHLGGADLSERDLSGVDLTGANLEGATLSRTRLVGACLEGANLDAAQLHRADLTDASLAGASLEMASFRYVTAPRADLSEAKLEMTRFHGGDFRSARFDEVAGQLASFVEVALDEAVFRGAQLEMTMFDECSLLASDWSGASLTACDFRSCKAEQIRLVDTSVERSGFSDSSLLGAVIEGAHGGRTVWLRSDLSGASIEHCELPGAAFVEVVAKTTSFRSSNLEDSRFDKANLREADFSGAKLSYGNLRRASLTKVSFRGASLYQAILVESAGTGVDFREARLDGSNFERSQVTR